MTFNESDWKFFRTRLQIWQESYIEKLNREYIALLTGSSSATDKFWKLNGRMEADKRSVCIVARMSRSNMDLNMLHLLHDGVITMADFDDFSEELREKMAFATRKCDDYEPSDDL